MPGNGFAEISKNITEPGAYHGGWAKQFVSDSLKAQYLNFPYMTFIADMIEGSGQQNFKVVLYIYIWKADDTGIRAELTGGVASLVEIDMTWNSLQTFFNNLQIGDANCLEGDKLVLEMFINCDNTRTNTWIHGLRFDGAIGSGNESYIEFSQDIKFLSKRLSRFFISSQDLFIKIHPHKD